MAKVIQNVSPVMDELLKFAPVFQQPALGSLVEGTVIDIVGSKILVDLFGLATGIISGKEARDSSGTLGKIQPGDTISAYVIGEEGGDGYYVLSLSKASQERTWRKFVLAYDQNETINVTIHEANKGGLLVLVDGIKGFIPVSQLAPMHYPRVDGADAAEILKRLMRLVGEVLQVKIITLDQTGGKLILSEKAALQEQREDALKRLQIGHAVDGVVSGIVKFGIFVAFDGLEGLVHISEIEWGHVKDPGTYAKIGDRVSVQIIGLEGDKISLSMKRLTPDPWKKAAQKYQVGNTVKGRVDRITQFGVFVKLEDDISGLIHLSELSHDPVKDAHKFVKVGETIDVKIIAIDPDDHRIGLSLKALQAAPDVFVPASEESAEESAPKEAKKEKKTKSKHPVAEATE